MKFNEETLATSSPIRKPQFKLKYRSKSHRSLALKSLEKLVMLNGRLYWMDVKCEFHDLSDLLQNMASSDWICLPSAKSKGMSESKSFRLNAKRQVTSSELNKLNRAAVLWSKQVARMAAGRGCKRELNRQRSELASVRQRIAFLFDQLQRKGAVPTCENSAGRIVLDEAQEAEFANMFLKVKRGSPTWNSRSHNLAAFVYWCGGVDAFLRFSNAINRVPRQTTRFLKLLKRANRWTESLQKRLDTETGYSVRHDFENNALNDEVHQWMDKRRLNRGSRGKIGQRLAKAVQNYAEAYRKVSTRTSIQLPSILAAYAICAKQGTELIQFPIDYAFEEEPVNQLDLRRFASVQIDLSKSRSYSRFVKFVNANISHVTSGSRLRDIFGWIENGSDFEDIQFMLDNEVALAAGIKLRPVRKAAERYHRVFGRRQDNPSFSNLHDRLQNAFPMEAADRVVGWLEIFPPEVFTRGLCERTIGVLRLLIEIGEFEALRPAIDDTLNDWSSRSQQVRDCVPDEGSHPRELRSWLRRLMYFQKLAGDSVRVPVSVRRFLDGPKRQQREKQHLIELQEKHELNHKQFCRLEALRDKPFDQKRFDRKATLLVMESCVLTAIESLRSLLLGLAKKVWQDATGQSVPGNWSDQRCIEFAGWIGRMQPSEKRLLRQIFDAYQRHGQDAKQRQPFNRAWIEDQRNSGFRINHWILPAMEQVRVGGQRFTISICHDPCELLLMGVLFDTCLAPGGCNEMSVLANAADVNKQVLYVRDERGQVVARKLLAVSRKSTLLGYYCYLSYDASEDCVVCKSLSDFISQYCGRLAAKVGWQLANEGEPIGLGHFWYDDGEVNWDVAATEARIRARVQLASALAYRPMIQGFAVSHQ